MKRILLLALSPLLLFSLAHVPQNGHELTVEVTGVVRTDGKILVAVFAQKDAAGFPENTKMLCAYRLVAPKVPTTQVRIGALPAGRYAYSVLHDLNQNQYTDKNLVGYPKEPYGFSNNIRPWYKAPSFDECAFELRADTRHEVRLLD